MTTHYDMVPVPMEPLPDEGKKSKQETPWKPPRKSPFYAAMERVTQEWPPGTRIRLATYKRVRTAQEIINDVATGRRPVPHGWDDWLMKAEIEEVNGKKVSRLYVTWLGIVRPPHE